MIKNGKSVYREDCECSFCNAQRPKPKKRKLTYERKKMRVEAKALKVDFSYCEDCGAPKQCVHHITPLAEGGTNDMNNLKALCNSCHRQYNPELPEILFK